MLLLFHLDFSGGTDFNYANATSQFRQTFLEFLAIVVAGRIADKCTNLRNTGTDLPVRARAFNNSCEIFVSSHCTSSTEILQCSIVQLQARLLSDNSCTSENRNIFQHGITPVAKAGGFHAQDFEGSTRLIDHQGCQSFTINIFGNNEQFFTATLQNLLKNGQNISQCADLPIGDQNIGIA